jgi:predicted nucleic acid-binding protein
MRQWQSDGTPVITTNYVLLELVALFASPLRLPRQRSVATIEAIRTARWVEVLHIDPTLHEEAWSLLRQRQDKEWSLVDCASFVVMTHRGIGEALTTDRHFEQASFVRLLG